MGGAYLKIDQNIGGRMFLCLPVHTNCVVLVGPKFSDQRYGPKIKNLSIYDYLTNFTPHVSEELESILCKCYISQYVSLDFLIL